MARLKIVRPNGEEEFAELTTDKSLVGKNYLKLDISGVAHYAKAGEVVSTHMYMFNGIDGKKYYIQKEIEEPEDFREFTGGDTLDIPQGFTVLKITDIGGNTYIKIDDGAQIEVTFMWLHVGVDYRWKILDMNTDSYCFGQATLKDKYLKISWSREINNHAPDFDISNG